MLRRIAFHAGHFRIVDRNAYYTGRNSHEVRQHFVNNGFFVGQLSPLNCIFPYGHADDIDGLEILIMLSRNLLSDSQKFDAGTS